MQNEIMLHANISFDLKRGRGQCGHNQTNTQLTGYIQAVIYWIYVGGKTITMKETSYVHILDLLFAEKPDQFICLAEWRMAQAWHTRQDQDSPLTASISSGHSNG